MTRRSSVRRLVPTLLACAALLTPVAAEQSRAQRAGQAQTKEDLANARPGRDPNQPIDEEYARKIKEHTTETFFLSPLVDYLPASKTVPTPKAVLGDIAGAAGKLPDTKEIWRGSPIGSYILVFNALLNHDNLDAGRLLDPR